MSKTLNKINEILFDKIGLEDEDVQEIQINRFSKNTYYRFKVYDMDYEDFFHLGAMLGKEFGDENLWIDTYLSTPKYRGFTQLEIRA